MSDEMERAHELLREAEENNERINRILDALEERYDKPPTSWERLTVPIHNWFMHRRYGKPSA